jgi:predicted RNA-binding Zn-ribbon protein involved in translation (DUF1610 family)
MAEVSPPEDELLIVEEPPTAETSSVEDLAPMEDLSPMTEEPPVTQVPPSAQTASAARFPPVTQTPPAAHIPPAAPPSPDKLQDEQPASGTGESVARPNEALIMGCPSCGVRISKRAHQCPKCGRSPYEHCQVCAIRILTNSDSCPECGDPDPFNTDPA